MKKILSMLGLMSVLVVGITAGANPASAVSPTANLFALNIANQTSGSSAANYYNLDGKLYFTASTKSKATALWALTEGDYVTEPTMIFDPFEGTVSGTISNLWGSDHFLFFWVSNTTNYEGMKAYVLNTRTNVVKALVDQADSANTVSSRENYGSWTTTDDGEIYGYTSMNGSYQSQGIHLVHFNKTDMTIADLGATTFNGEWGIFSSGLNVYVLSKSWVYGEGSQVSKLYQYNTQTETWSGPLTYADGTTQIYHIIAIGEYNFNGEDVFVFSNPSKINVYPWYTEYTDYQYYAVKPDGSIILMSTLKHPNNDMRMFNFKNELYLSPWYGGLLSHIDPATGTVTNMTETLFPGKGALFNQVGYWKVVADKFVFTARIDGAVNNGSLLYQWDGVGAAVKFSDINKPAGQYSFDGMYSTSNDITGGSIGASGDRAVVTIVRDDYIGGEPYYVAPDGTVTLVKNMQLASAGSAPSTECFISTSTGDWMSASLPYQLLGGQGKSVIVSMKPEGSFLKYSVIDPGDIIRPCAFTYVGADIYFQGYDATSEKYGIYKMIPDGTISLVHELIYSWDDKKNEENGFKAFSYNGDYYWMARNYYHNDLFKYDIQTDTVTYLGADTWADWQANNGKPIPRDSVDAYELIGNKLYIQADDKIWVANLDDEVFTPVSVVENLLENAPWNSVSANQMTRYGDTVIFAGQPESRDRSAVLIVDPLTNTSSKLFEAINDPEGRGWVNTLLVIGNKIYVKFYDNDQGFNGLYKWTSGPVATKMPLPDGMRLNCLAPTGGDLIVQGENGKSYYYGNGLNSKAIEYDFSGNTYAFCNAAVTDHGTYLALPEYPYDNQGRGFGSEPGYIGPLTPVAVSRLGEPVTEAPAVPLSSAIPSEVPPAAPGTPGTPIATSGAGKVSLTWTAPTTGGDVARYIVESTPAGAQCEIVGTTAQCIGLDEGTNYTFNVIATNEGGLAPSAASNSVSPGPATTAPGKPGTPVGTGKAGGATLTWTAPTDGGTVDSYVVITSPAGGTCVVTGTTADCTGLEDGTDYTFTVVAVNDVDTNFSEASAAVTAGDPSLMPPGSLDGISPTITRGIKSLTVTVTPPAGGGTVTYYEVVLWDDELTCQIDAPATSCTFTNLDPNTEYYAEYRAWNDNGRSNWSDSSDWEYPLAAAAPNTPTIGDIVAGHGKLTVNVTGADYGAPASTYVVTLSPGGATCTVVVPATSCDVEGLTSTQSYTATVVAKNEYGDSAATDPSAATTPLIAKPGTPGTTTVVAGNGKVTVTPTRGTTGDAPDSYKITANPGGLFCTVTLPATSCEITGLTNLTYYTFTTTATNEGGTSRDSAPTAAVAPFDPNGDVAPTEGDGDKPAKSITSNGKFIATNDPTFQLAWTKATGKLVSQATGIYTGYIEGKITFTKAGKTYSCTTVFGTLKAMPMKTAAQKTAAMKLKTFTGKQFCIDKIKMDPKTTAPKGGMTKANFLKIKSMNKTAAELTAEKAALAALKNFSGDVQIQITRYRAWPTTMWNYGEHTGKGGKISTLIRNTKVKLG